MIYCNARYTAYSLSGMGTYLNAILARISPSITLLKPKRPIRGGAGILWDQTITPLRIGKKDVLWSPANIGSLSVKDQVVTLHDLAPIDHPEWFSLQVVCAYRYLLPIVLRRVRHVITVSNYSAERIHKVLGFAYDRMSVIPNGVEEELFLNSSRERPAVCLDRNGTPIRYVFFLGRARDPRKNVSTVLKAWEIALRSLPEDLMLFVGGMEAPAGLSPALQDRIKFLGVLSDVELKGVMGHARMFLFPSMYEGFGLPPLEAFAAGVPVIASNQTSVPEVVGDCAILFDPQDIEQLADAISRLARSDKLACELRSRGVSRARSMSWDKVARETLRVLQSV